VLTDRKAIEIVSKAKQKNVRDPKRSREHFHNIFDDFFKGVEFSGEYLDMGPGQYDFGVLAKDRGAEQCTAIEFDPVVVELGEYLGFNVIEGNIKKYSHEMVSKKLFTGVFNKFTYNCFWYLDKPEQHKRFVGELTASVKDGGWAWIAPWNGVPKAKTVSESLIQSQLNEQIELFENNGFVTVPLSDDLARRYGVHGAVANNVVFHLAEKGAGLR